VGDARPNGSSKHGEPKGTRDNVIQLRVSDAELAELRSRAQASGRSVPQVIRVCVFGESCDP
jgi:hypothetical protein